MVTSPGRYHAVVGSLTFWGGARPSFLSGVASVVDLGNTLSEYSTIPASVYDTFQLSQDWRMIGEDMRKVLAQSARELEKSRRGLDLGAL